MHSPQQAAATTCDLELVARQTERADRAPTSRTSATRRRSSPAASGRDVILIEDFNAALERVVAGMESRRVMNDHEKRVVAYHEAGHALCSELLPSVEKVHKISIVPRGRALGYTLNLPEEDRYLKSKEELTDYLVVLLGGRVAEHIVFGSVTTGASDDLQEGQRDQPRDGRRVRHGQLDELAPARDRRLLDLRQHPPPGGRGAGRHHRRRLPPRPPADHRATATCSRSSRKTLLDQEVLEREDIERIVGARARRRRSQPAEPGPAPDRRGRAREAVARSARS